MTTTAEVAPATDERSLGDPRRWWIMGVLGAVAFMATLDIYIVNVALPAISSAFAGQSLAAVSWVLNGYAIVFAAVMVPAGRLADHFGRRRMLLAGMVIFAIGSAACAAAPTLSLLVTGRVVQAFGAAAIVPISMSLLLPTFPAARHAMVLGLWAAIMAVAASTGPVVGGLLVGVGWRWLFLINVPIAAAALVVGLWCLPRVARDPRSHPPEPWSVGGVLVGVTLVVLATVQGPEWGWGSPRVIGLYVVAAIAAAVVVLRSRRHPHAVIESVLFANREFRSASIGLFVFFGVLSVWLLSTVLLLEGVWHYGTVRVGLAILPGPAVAAVVSINAARIARRFGRSVPAIVGLVMFGLAAGLWLSGARDHSSYASTFLPALLVAGLGAGLAQAPLLAAAGALPPARFSTGSAVLNMSRQIGGAVFVAVLVALAGGSTLPQTIAPVRRAWILMAAAALAGAALITVMRLRPVNKQAMETR
ncbi:MFS transporter [Actinoplanes sp. TBRC 11911]|uniref:MFS transporter n=1 Tax=Actinoplanes sp. TBRC 11911 TaxID=2729386 RepID=UPI00145ED047|nr:MFS transporter [Actinoplanes sp. TBRC 11911]NMO52298.1 MFS transporter [Actinoplanes sp. TBRC 11911]